MPTALTKEIIVGLKTPSDINRKMRSYQGGQPGNLMSKDVGVIPMGAEYDIAKFYTGEPLTEEALRNIATIMSRRRRR